LKVKGMGKKTARAVLNGVIKNLWKDIKSGKLAPYDNKDVIL